MQEKLFINPDVWQDQLEQLEQICYEKGIKEVEFKAGKGDYYFHEERKILIDTNNNAEKMFYILLHEYGHYKIMKDEAYLGKKYAKIATCSKPKTLSLQVLSVEEEVMAWFFGEELANEYGFTIDFKRFRFLKAKCLKSHINSHSKIMEQTQ